MPAYIYTVNGISGNDEYLLALYFLMLPLIFVQVNSTAIMLTIEERQVNSTAIMLTIY